MLSRESVRAEHPLLDLCKTMCQQIPNHKPNLNAIGPAVPEIQNRDVHARTLRTYASAAPHPLIVQWSKIMDSKPHIKFERNKVQPSQGYRESNIFVTPNAVQW